MPCQIGHCDLWRILLLLLAVAAALKFGLFWRQYAQKPHERLKSACCSKQQLLGQLNMARQGADCPSRHLRRASYLFEIWYERVSLVCSAAHDGNRTQGL